MVRVREAGPADAAALAAVAAATFRLACPPSSREEDMAEFIATQLSEERMREYLADPTRRLFLAEAEPSAGAPLVAVGYTMLVSGEPADPDVASSITVRPTAELSKCYVLGSHHGSGVASVLIEATVDAARADGAAAVWLGVNQHNARANAFYARHGFVQVGVKRFLVGTRWEDDYVRERVL